jgi:ATP-dependent DNA ligase
MIYLESDGTLTAFSRRNLPIKLPGRVMQDFATFHDLTSSATTRWIFDAEIMEESIWIFDMLAFPMEEGIYKKPFKQRRESLEQVFNVWTLSDPHPHIGLTRCAKTTADKMDMFAEARRTRAEGVMVKDIAAAYRPGKRTYEMRKIKFTETCEAIVSEVGREENGRVKSSLGLYMMDANTKEVRDVGAVTVTNKVLSRARQGDIVEVGYLYMTDSFKLYQPTFVKFRDDKKPLDCDVAQCKMTNKSVVL